MRKLVLLSLVVTSMFATQNLDELIDIALKNSPDIKISKLDVESAKSGVDFATSYYLPQLDLSGQYGKGGSKFKRANGFNNYDVIGATATASQLIYDFGKTGGSIESRKYDLSSYNATYSQAISDKILEVKQKFYDLLKAQSLISVNEENVKLNEAQLYRAKRYYEAGIRTKIDISDANVNLINGQINLQNSKYDSRLAYVNLEKVLGEIGNKIEVENLPLEYNRLYSTLPLVSEDISQLTNYAFKNRYEIKAYQESIKSAKAALKSVDGDYFPSIGLNGNYALNKVDGDMALLQAEKQWSAGVVASWNIFSGFNTNASSQIAKIAVLKSNETLLNIKLQIQRDVNEAFIVVQKTKENVKLNSSLKDSSFEKFDQAQKRYENGLSDYIELQQARQEYIDSLSGLVIAYYSYYQALANLDNSIGR
ncbi:MAG: TolC family protein [Campylobacterota bacterium]|nr:TolC family protein [Campylobacterota bacterium]